LFVMEQGTVRGTIARTIRTATEVASGLGRKKEANDDD
jgi:hypothetical protein